MGWWLSQPTVKILTALECWPNGWGVTGHKPKYQSCKTEWHQDEWDKSFPVSEKNSSWPRCPKTLPSFPRLTFRHRAICNPHLNGPVTELHGGANSTLIPLHFHGLGWLEGGRCLSPLTEQLPGISLKAFRKTVHCKNKLRSPFQPTGKLQFEAEESKTYPPYPWALDTQLPLTHPASRCLSRR